MCLWETTHDSPGGRAHPLVLFFTRNSWPPPTSSQLLRVSLVIHAHFVASQTVLFLKYYVINIMSFLSSQLLVLLCEIPFHQNFPPPHQIRYCNFNPTFWVICTFITESSLFRKAASKIHSQRLSWGSTQGTVVRMVVSVCVHVCALVHTVTKRTLLKCGRRDIGVPLSRQRWWSVPLVFICSWEIIAYRGEKGKEANTKALKKACNLNTPYGYFLSFLLNKHLVFFLFEVLAGSIREKLMSS